MDYQHAFLFYDWTPCERRLGILEPDDFCAGKNVCELACRLHTLVSAIEQHCQKVHPRRNRGAQDHFLLEKLDGPGRSLLCGISEQLRRHILVNDTDFGYFGHIIESGPLGWGWRKKKAIGWLPDSI